MDYTDNKFLVVNRKHILQSLNGGELHQLEELLAKIDNHGNKYWVVNQDEPYAEQVHKLIDESERKEIVAFTGRQGAGKDYQSDLLVQNRHFKKMAFADALRKITFKALGINYYDGLAQYDRLKQTEVTKFGYTLRQVLEQLGTECIRKYDNDFWVKCLLKDLKESGAKKVCVSDLRFPNEFKGLAKFAQENGYTFTCYFCDYHSDRYVSNNRHASARLSNWLKSKGFSDLEQIHINDILDYENEEGE